MKIGTIKTIIIILLFSCLVGCDRLNLNDSLVGDRPSQLPVLAANNSNLTETTAPKTIRKLSQRLLRRTTTEPALTVGQNLQQDSPQIKIIAPKIGQTLKGTDVAIELAVEDFSVFKDDRFGLGNHINLIIDNEPPQAIYSVEEPIIIKNLAPGTHTIRAFAVRPWGESVKTKEAYAQTTFNVLTETQDNLPNPDYPLLTYNSPTGTYGAEPILLDFYLSNSDLDIDKSNNLEQYSVKATVNGTSFIINDWQPYYLTGFETGDNWIQLELIDRGSTIENAFNNTVRVFKYDPQQEDALAKLVTERVSFNDAKLIVNPDSYIKPAQTPEIIDFEAIAEPETVIVDESEEEAISLAPETSDRNLNNQTEISKIDSVAEPTAIVPLVEQKSEDIKVLVDDDLSKQIETTAIDSVNRELSPLVDSRDKPADLSTIENAEPEIKAPLTADKAQKIIISEPDASENPVAEITIPQPKSVEITESEIAITIPDSQTQPDPDLQERSPKATLWWKKILVGIRQTIEALARKLPSEV